MLRFVTAFVTGVYTAQECDSKLPRVKHIAQDVMKEVQKSELYKTIVQDKKR